MSFEFSMTLRPNIELVYWDRQFERRVKADLALIESTVIGRRLIEKIGRASHTVFIEWGDTNECIPESWPQRSLCTISFTGKTSDYLTLNLNKARYRSFMILAHELIHAYHCVYGKFQRVHSSVDKMVWCSTEEYATIMGLPSKNPYRNVPKICENAFLQECGFPKRFSHFRLSCLFDHPVQYQRVQLAAALFKQRSLTFSPHEQVCPPLIPLTADLLEPSTKVIRIFRTRNHEVLYTVLNVEASEGFVSRDIPSHMWTQGITAPCSIRRIVSISDHRLSPAEVAASGKRIRKRKRLDD